MKMVEPVLFHVDRSLSLRDGMVLELFTDYNIDDEFVEKKDACNIKQRYGGFTNHGMRSIQERVSVNSYIESMAEMIRINRFPKMPSRFQSVFGIEYDDIEKLVDVLKISEYKIFQIASEKYVRLDMKLLKAGNYITADYFLNKYWNMEVSEDPLFEYLLQPPVKIIREIKQ